MKIHDTEDSYKYPLVELLLPQKLSTITSRHLSFKHFILTALPNLNVGWLVTGLL